MKTENSIVRDLTTGNPVRQLLYFSIPFVFANLLQQLYNMADMVIIGQYVGSAGLTAASNAGEVATMFLFIAAGIASAGQIVISQHIGAGNRDRLGKSIGTLFTFGFILAAVLTVIALIFCDFSLELIHVPEEAMDYAHDYAFVYFCGIIPVFGYNLVSSILRGLGDGKHPFIFVAIAAILNIILDLLFVGPLEMECFGAALATVISQTVSFVISMCFLYKHREDFSFDFKLKSFRVDRRELKPILKMGVPISIQSVAITGSMLYINSMINQLGVTAAAATAVGNKLTLLATVCTGAMNMAGNSIVGQNFAAKKFKRVTITLTSILCVGLVFCSLLGVSLLLFPEQIFSLFDKDPAVLALSHDYTVYGFFSLLGFATRAAAFSLLNGIGNSQLSFLCSIADGIVARIGFSLLFGVAMEMGLNGFWLGGAIAGNVIGVIIFFYYLSGVWKKRKLLID